MEQHPFEEGHTRRLFVASVDSFCSSEPPDVPLVGVARMGVVSRDTVAGTFNSMLAEPVGGGDVMDGEEEGGGRDMGGDKGEGEGGMRLNSSISRME